MSIKPSTTQQQKLPPVESGDRLSRQEFERRYQAMSTSQKAELIEGIVYMASPLRFESHAEPHSNLIGLLWTYRLATPGVRLGIEPTLRLDLDNEPQPDAVLFIEERFGGKCRISEDDYQGRHTRISGRNCRPLVQDMIYMIKNVPIVAIKFKNI